MKHIAQLDPADRDFVFRKVSYDSGMSEAIVEKDYWILHK